MSFICKDDFFLPKWPSFASLTSISANKWSKHRTKFIQKTFCKPAEDFEIPSLLIKLKQPKPQVAVV